MRNVYRRSTAVAVQQRDPLGKLALLGSPEVILLLWAQKMSAANMH